MVPCLRPTRGKAAGHPRPRRQLLDRRRLAQLAVADLAGRGTAGEPAKRPDVPGRRARRHPPARPAFELHHRSGVRRRPANDDLEAVRHQHHDDRAALRRRDRELEREAGSGGRTDPGRAGAADPPNRRHGRRDEAPSRRLRARPPQSWWTLNGRRGKNRASGSPATNILISRAFNSKPTPGLEPGTPSLRVKCSTS